MSDTIDTVVLQDMRLLLSPAEIGREGEHNSAVFRIIRQPAELDQYACRAEVAIGGKKTYRLVEDGEFNLTNDITEVSGRGTLQLVYSDGTEIIRKTDLAPFHVSRSINAVDQSDPTFQDGLAQLQTAAFAAVTGTDTAATFYNINGQPVAALPYPPGQGGGLDEAAANLLYVRQDGGTGMSGDLRMISSGGIDAPISIYIGGRQAAIGWENGTVMRRGTAGEGVYIADNNGTNRSLVMTQAFGDTSYIRKAGDQMQGPLITATGSSATNPGLAVGDNATGFYRVGGTLLLSVGGQMYQQWLASPPSLMMTIPLNMATQAIQGLADPRDGAPGAQDAVNRRTLETAIAAIPRQIIPAARVYIPTEVTIGNTATEFFNQPFFTNDNAPRTIVVTVHPQYASGTPSAFYDLEYTTGLSVGLLEKVAIYPTAAAYMGSGTVCFAATVTPVSSQIQVSLSVRQMSNQPTPLVQIGSRADQRSYVIIQEMTN